MAKATEAVAEAVTEWLWQADAEAEAPGGGINRGGDTAEAAELWPRADGSDDCCDG